MRKPAILIITAALVLTSSCTNSTAESGSLAVQPSEQASETAALTKRIEPYSDVRMVNGSIVPDGIQPEKGNYSPEDIATFWFNRDTVFPEGEDLAAEILENGKNPGLGVRSLHERGITGKSVKVAIIDQNLAQPFHSEFGDRIVQYKDFGTGQPEKNGSMHGPGVASLLVGQSCGVAPDAELYFAAAPSWSRDSAYYADALRWIIETNRDLPEEDKIRVVSVSAAPSGDGSPFIKNTEMWDDAVAEAQKAGILVLDCRRGCDTGIIAPGYYDPEEPDDVTHFSTGFPQEPYETRMDGVVFAPTSARTTAEEYSAGHESYQYTGQGGLSWGIPYIAGVLALGWQTDPSLSNEEILSLLFESAYIDENGNKIVNPTAFISAVEAR
ncbi:S8 family serine peptidase [Papillibacter cinnamivorans]|uniref:Peptidase S8/S53 domain-containing protein n=1 Tax=Papillibacter cinnamivorans DSM 12816 TaxID=1122930 RepID=A0A1W1YWL2_9FIRM|nr:S8 family serine peptidase [Papillibacter cinnamivorans]SMC40534.1 hypothetical protein SAMN02745168_0731 [Papillibacter cinnamivorans DSM 12816]